MEEQEAIARLKRGDIGGLEALVRKHQVQAVRTAYLITRDRALAEDIVQTAFLRRGVSPTIRYLPLAIPHPPDDDSTPRIGQAGPYQHPGEAKGNG
jgi:hypothetical protein